ncbi:tyrosine-type recombinase/integrase [Aestuariivirga sp.]|uniref:tyrosine-type recombinase/integrase n=1 Tax=Aestuariivirga sp. TaxID=2650926 RepID=UPI0039E23500
MAVIDRKNAPGAGRIKKVVTGERSKAEDVEREIIGSLKTFGMWPVPPGTPPKASSDPYRPRNNLTETFDLACSSLWVAQRTERVSVFFAREWRDWFTSEHVTSMDAITTAHIEKAIATFRTRGNKPSTINSKLSALRGVIAFAYSRTPKLMTNLLMVPTVTKPVVPKWWLRPEWVPPLVELAMREGMDVMADYIPFIVFTGLRVEEALRLYPKDFAGLDSDKPTIKVPGSKTKSSEATVPLFKEAAMIVKKRIARQGDRLAIFPIGYPTMADQWAKLRELSEWHNETTCTLKALRRTFAKIANDRGLGGFDIMKLLRHTSINTTQGYLTLTGDEADVERLRSRFEGRPH